MQVTEIQVHASTGFKHPHERFANFKLGVTLKATIQPGENIWEATRQLQTLAESLVQAEKEATLKRIEEAYVESGDNQEDDDEDDDVEDFANAA